MYSQFTRMLLRSKLNEVFVSAMEKLKVIVLQTELQTELHNIVCFWEETTVVVVASLVFVTTAVTKKTGIGKKLELQYLFTKY